jgi:hypothetical protein
VVERVLADAVARREEIDLEPRVVPDVPVDLERRAVERVVVRLPDLRAVLLLAINQFSFGLFVFIRLSAVGRLFFCDGFIDQSKMYRNRLAARDRQKSFSMLFLVDFVEWVRDERLSTNLARR